MSHWSPAGVVAVLSSTISAFLAAAEASKSNLIGVGAAALTCAGTVYAGKWISGAVVNKLVDALLERMDSHIEPRFKALEDKLQKHDERVINASRPRRATDPSDASWEEARGEYPA